MNTNSVLGNIASDLHIITRYLILFMMAKILLETIIVIIIKTSIAIYKYIKKRYRTLAYALIPGIFIFITISAITTIKFVTGFTTKLPYFSTQSTTDDLTVLLDEVLLCGLTSADIIVHGIILRKRNNKDNGTNTPTQESNEQNKKSDNINLKI